MSKIEWTDITANPIVVRGDDGKPDGWYCEKTSPGCASCYAEGINATAYYKGNGMPYRLPKDGQRPELMLKTEILKKWSRMRKPKKIFVCSMTDIAGEFVPEDFFYQTFDAMANAPKQIFQILTKRAENLFALTTEWLDRNSLTAVPKNIWLGVSAENQKYYDERVYFLENIPAAVKWVSAEPIVGPITIKPCSYCENNEPPHMPPCIMCNGTGYPINWVVAGGESGHKARMPLPTWFFDIQDQCEKAKIAFFFKQWGEYRVGYAWRDYMTTYDTDEYIVLPTKHVKRHGYDHDMNAGIVGIKVGKKKSGNLLRGVKYEQFPTTSLV